AFSVTQHYTGVDKIEAFGGQGNDTITFAHSGGSAGIPITVDAGQGDDTIDATGWLGDTVITGGTGNDTIIGGLNANIIHGNDGNDIIVIPNSNPGITNWLFGDAGD